MEVEANVYDDEFEEFRVRANSGGTLPESWRRRKELLVEQKNRLHSDGSVPAERPAGKPRSGSFKVPSYKYRYADNDDNVHFNRKTSVQSAPVTHRHIGMSRKRSGGSPPKKDSVVCNGSNGIHVRSRSANSSRIFYKEPEDPFRYYETKKAMEETGPNSDTFDKDLLICNRQFDDFNLQERPMRPRVSTMPSRNEMVKMRIKNKGTLSTTRGETGIEHRRVRSFKITSKGVVRSNESFVVRGHSPGSEEHLDWMLRNGSMSSLGSSQSDASNEHKIYNVAMLGTERVGKKSLIHRFISSESNGPQNFSFGESK